GHSRQAGGRRDSIKRQVAWRNHQSHVRGSQRLEPHAKGIFGNFSNPSFIQMFPPHQPTGQWCSVVLFAPIPALTVEKQYAMKFVVAFSLVAKHRSQSQNAISAHEYSCKALVVSSQQQAITVMTISQPLLFAGVSRQNQAYVPSQRSEHCFIFSEHFLANRIHQVTSLFLSIRRQLFTRQTQLRHRCAEGAFDFPFENFFHLSA